MMQMWLRGAGAARRALHTSAAARAPVLLVADADDGASRAAVTAAARLGAGDVHALVLAGDAAGAANAADAAARIAGVARVRVCADAQLAHSRPEPAAATIAAAARDGAYSHVVFAATAHGRSLLGRVAGLLDTMPVTDVTAVAAADTFVRPIYAGNALATVRSAAAIKLFSVRPTSFEKAPRSDAPAPVEPLAWRPSDASDASAWLEDRVKSSDRPDLTAARVVVSGGRALKSKENFAILEKLADKLGAAVGASRAAVDAGYAPNDWQVGQTGKIVAPELYIAAGISGQIQHVAGMKDSKCIVAINTDVDAPFFLVADYGLVEDLFKAVPEMAEKL
jgi:electron transfer flavoprotein alpha subunit